MDAGLMLYNNLKDVKWSATSLPLDRLVSSYRLPQIVRLNTGESVEGLRDNDYILLHSCRQWTTITAHSLEEGHYVIGPKIEIPVHYGGQFKLLEQDRDIKEPVQYFNSVEEVAKAFPERVYVMEEITFNVKVASGDCNEDTEVYNITLSTGDELTLMGQAEILYAKTSREKSRLNTIFKKIGKLNSISKLGRGKMPCLICMNHRTNESISLPFQCKGRFSTRSPLEIQMQEGEHTIRNIVEKTRLPVNVIVPSTPPRNQYDLHLIREGHRYKFVNIQTKTVVVCIVLRSNKIIPIHFPLHLAMPQFTIPEGLLKNESWLETMVHRWLSFCQEQFDIDEYSRAVRDVRVDWNEDCKSPKKNSSCPGHSHMPNSLSSARDELTQSFHRLSVCVYGSNLHGNSEVNLQGCKNLCGDWALLSHDSMHCTDSGDSGSDYLFPEVTEDPRQLLPTKSDIPYEELWLDQGMERHAGQSVSCSAVEMNKCDGNRSSVQLKGTATSPLPAPGPACSAKVSEISLPPPPVPPKSEAVKEECRLLNVPPVPPRSSKPASTSPSVPSRTAQLRQHQTRSPSPTLSYYSSGLHNIIVTEKDAPQPAEQNPVCYPCNWMKPDSTDNDNKSPFGSPTFESVPSRSSWPNNFCGATDSHGINDFLPVQCRSYYSYPRQKTPGTPKGNIPASFDASGTEFSEGCASPPKTDEAPVILPGCHKSGTYSLESYTDKTLAECSTAQSQTCPILPPRAPKLNEEKLSTEVSFLPSTIDGAEEEPQTCSTDPAGDNLLVNKGTPDIFSISYPFSSPLHLQLAPRSCGDGSPWQPPSDLSELSVEEVSKSLRFIGLSEDVVSLFVTEKIDGNLLVQLTEEILSEDFKLSKLQVKKLIQFISGWRPKM
ncbi:GRB2-associated and regulator of MAPK protein 1-like [Acipenser oxyrinchus oxyrinchus]|uniref:GRB2-associated and regulator of MAPK protein 1-like n=1 Tax=Acipenser oxyrinchus oxyrinchus TaxID=40147 RepID=A0AAD8GGF2_ACIOX|nr:GRB2-associated and regulator of MAPK protein 1-like [Acipenser oxyrinchus oxyrinchus]